MQIKALKDNVAAEKVANQTEINSLNSMQKLQNNWHVQHTDAQVNRNSIDNINPKQKMDKKHHILTHTQEAKTQDHF